MQNHMVTIASFDNLFEAELAKSLLEDYGFTVVLLNERIMATYPTVAGDMFRIELQVIEQDQEKASEILETLENNSFVAELLKSESAFLEGHFLLTSGKHSDKYIEKIRILQNPEVTHTLCKRLAEIVIKHDFDAVVGPAYGGIALAYDVARLLGKQFIFTQRKDEKMSVRSGFDLSGIKKILIIEDIITTGGSVQEVIDCFLKLDIEISAIGAIVDRSGGQIDFGYPLHCLMSISVPSWLPEDCELCKQGIELIKPGSSDKK